MHEENCLCLAPDANLISDINKTSLKQLNLFQRRCVPWGNAWHNFDGSFACQNWHFRFIHCVERLTLQNKHGKWADYFEMLKLGTVPIDCYDIGYGNQIETKYAKETAKLNPPHRLVPWLVVNNKPLAENYDKYS
ncbi:hypothetical protein ACLB2K_061375 [Fragaria x ananassa]